MTLKHCAIQPANNLFPRAQPDLFGGMPNMLDSSNPPRQGNLITYQTANKTSGLISFYNLPICYAACNIS
jgi:hypothetical protein